MLLGLIQGDQEYISLLILEVQNPFLATRCRFLGQGVVAEGCKSLRPGVGSVEFKGVCETQVNGFFRVFDMFSVVLKEVVDLASELIVLKNIREYFPNIYILLGERLILQ